MGVGTLGSADHSVLVGLGLARELGDRFAQTEPILMLGGQTRLSRSVALVSESWLVLDGETPLSEQPLGSAARPAPMLTGGGKRP